MVGTNLATRHAGRDVGIGGASTYLDARSSDLSDLLNLGAGLSDQGAALRGGHDQTERDGGTGHAASDASGALQTSRLTAHRGKNSHTRLYMGR